MSTIVSLLKSELMRIARKEIRAEMTALKKADASQRVELVALRKRVRELEHERQTRASAGTGARAPADRGTSIGHAVERSAHRFSGKGLAAHRQRLNLSRDELAYLLGTSPQSIYNWESGKARPRAHYMPAIIALRTLGAKQAASVLASRAASQ